MNDEQRKIILIGGIVCALLFLFPPWSLSCIGDNEVAYGLLFAPPSEANGVSCSVSGIYLPSLALEFLVVACVTIALLVDKKRRGKAAESK